MRNKIEILTVFLLILSSCATLPKTLNENNTIVVSNFKWIGKFGKTTISVGAAKPILKNVSTGKRYTPDYCSNSFSYFYRIEVGHYIVEEIVLDGGAFILHMKTSDKTRPFQIKNTGAHFIGGIDIIDYQTRLEYKTHDSIQNKDDLNSIRNILYAKTEFSTSSVIEYIEDVIIKENW